MCAHPAPTTTSGEPAFVAAYARESRDYGIYALVDFYQSYRATVRAKVSAMLAHDGALSSTTCARGQEEARRYLLLAIALGRRRQRAPRLLVMFGLIASGKSTLAATFAESTGAAMLSADYTRKELLGVRPEQPQHEAPFQGAYRSDFSALVYETLFSRAAQILQSGRDVVLDASFRETSERRRARELATSLGASLLFVECRCPRQVALERLARRAEAPSLSDGRAEIYDAFASRFEPASELTPHEHLSVDTTSPLPMALAHVQAALQLPARHASVAG